MNTQIINRRIDYKGDTLTDFAPHLPVADIVKMHVVTRPELISAVVEGPVLKDGEHVYTIQAKATTKG